MTSVYMVFETKRNSPKEVISDPLFVSLTHETAHTWKRLESKTNKKSYSVYEFQLEGVTLQQLRSAK